MTRFLEALTKKGFKYLSVLEGGFSGISRLLESSGIELLNFKTWSPRAFPKEDETVRASNFMPTSDTFMTNIQGLSKL